MKKTQKSILAIWINPIRRTLLLLPLLLLAGCASLRAGQMPTNNLTMEQTYQQAIVDGVNDNKATLTFLRSHVASTQTDILPRKNSDMSKAHDYSDMYRLSNPDIRMYVYPHWAKDEDDEILVPGYWTKFPFFQKIYYDFSAEM